MKILGIGGGEIWSAIESLLKEQGHKVLVVEKENVPVQDWSTMRAVVIAHCPDVVVYTAGVSFPAAIRDVMDSDITSSFRFEEEFEVNAMGAASVMGALQTANPEAIFIGMVSVAGMYGKPNHAGYSASKAALRSLIQSAAMEGLKAYGISPGRVDTSMRERDYPGENKETRLRPDEIAAVVFDILNGKYEPGDNIIIRRVGFETQPIQVDKGEPWKTELRIGLPPVH